MFYFFRIFIKAEKNPWSHIVHFQAKSDSYARLPILYQLLPGKINRFLGILNFHLLRGGYQTFLSVCYRGILQIILRSHIALTVSLGLPLYAIQKMRLQIHCSYVNGYSEHYRYSGFSKFQRSPELQSFFELP